MSAPGLFRVDKLRCRGGEKALHHGSGFRPPVEMRNFDVHRGDCDRLRGRRVGLDLAGREEGGRDKKIEAKETHEIY